LSLRPADHNSAAPVSLAADAVARTVALLSRRIEERFPGSGLSGVCRELERITTLTRERAEWIARPILSLRILARRDGRGAVTRQFLSACATPCRSPRGVRPAPCERTIASLPT